MGEYSLSDGCDSGAYVSMDSEETDSGAGSGINGAGVAGAGAEVWDSSVVAVKCVDYSKGALAGSVGSEE